MGFGTLLGNEALCQRLEAAIAQGKLSHGYVLCGPAGAGKHTLARWLAAAMQCSAQGAPCGKCNACRKVLAGIHPDVIVCEDQNHKQFGVDCARRICADACLRPNEGNRKVYIFPQELNLAAQNTLLKLIEEPPAYAAFLILSCNADQLLPTVRSRCQELRLSPLPEATILQALRQHCPGKAEADYRAAAAMSGGVLGQAIAAIDQTGLTEFSSLFAQAYAQRDRMGLLELLIRMEKLNRDDFCAELTRWHSLLHQALRASTGLPGSAEAQAIAAHREKSELLASLQQLHRTIERASANVGIGHLCGALQETL